MDFVAAVGAQEQPAAVVEPGEGAFDDPALAAELGTARALSPGDHGRDDSFADESRRGWDPFLSPLFACT